MIRLFDSVFLQPEWRLDPSSRAILLSRKAAEGVFLGNALNFGAILGFVEKAASFGELLAERFEGRTNSFWKFLCKEGRGEDLFIYADEWSYQEVLTAYLRSVYPRQSAEAGYPLYNLYLDRIEYNHPEYYRPECRKPMPVFVEFFGEIGPEPLDPELVPHLPVENLIGCYLARGRDSAFVGTLEASVLRAAEEFLWSREVIDYRTQVLTGLFWLGEADSALAADLENPDVESYVRLRPNMEAYCQPRGGQSFDELRTRYDLRRLLQDPIRKRIERHLAAGAVSGSSVHRRLVGACLEKDAVAIIDADIELKWGSVLLFESLNASRNNYWLAGYLYSCWRNRRHDLLSRFDLPAGDGA